METARNSPTVELSAPALLVEVSDTQSHLDVDAPALVELVQGTLKAEGVARASISLAIVDDAAIRRLNAQHLGHDWPTDVISFLLSDPDDPELGGELIVSAELAAATAREASTDPRAELALYIVHGLLHLCGLDDRTEEDAAVMRQRESEILTSLGWVNTFPLVGPRQPTEVSADESGMERVPCPR
jgi:probable rRNA maturation factor